MSDNARMRWLGYGLFLLAVVAPVYLMVALYSSSVVRRFLEETGLGGSR